MDGGLISTIKCKNHVILCCLSMVPEGRVDLVRLLEFCGYGMNTVSLRKSPMVDVCWGMPQQWLLNVRPWEWALNIWQFYFRQKLARLIFKSSAQIGQYSTNLMRSICVSSVFTGMWMTRIAPVRIVSKTSKKNKKTSKVEVPQWGMSRTHIVALDLLFDRINLDPKIQIRYIDTIHQLADILTKGNFKRDEWNNLFHLFNTSHFSSTCCTMNFSLISCSTMVKRVQEQKEEERPVS